MLCLSNLKTANMMVVSVMLLHSIIDHALNISKVLNMARNGYRAFIVEAILFFCIFQQLHEQWTTEIHEGSQFSVSHLHLAQVL